MFQEVSELNKQYPFIEKLIESSDAISLTEADLSLNEIYNPTIRDIISAYRRLKRIFRKKPRYRLLYLGF